MCHSLPRSTYTLLDDRHAKERCNWKVNKSLGGSNCLSVKERWFHKVLCRLFTPHTHDTLDMLADSQWFSTIDLVSKSKWRRQTDQIRHPALGLFQFHPFGLCDVPATIQCLMGLVLSRLQWSHCLVYLDDIIVLGKWPLPAVFDHLL